MSTSNVARAISKNPSTGVEFAQYDYETESALENAMTRACLAYASWRETDVKTRAQVIHNLAHALRKNAKQLAELATAEMGKPITQAHAEVEKCASLCEWYAANGPQMLEDELTSVEDNKAYISFRPLGPVLAVLPWNFPYWQVIRSAIPLILAGNTYVLKHAPSVMGCAYYLHKVWLEAGFPESVMEVINVQPELVSKAIQDDRIAAVTVTGSVRAGSAIASQAGAALKKCVLELGGSDPFIVLDDARIDAAVKAAVTGRFQNTGQVCIAAKRFIVTAGIFEQFKERFVQAVRELPIGDPLNEKTIIGPMARYDLRDELHQQVIKTINQGAELLIGGNTIPGAGNYYEPTVLSGVTPGMTSFQEELFGPVASLIKAESLEDAIALANNSEFGLAGSIWTEDLDLAHRMAAQLETGAVFINGNVASDPRIPIGGVKKSGFGRELSYYGVREFCNIQTVWQDRQ